MKDAHLKTRRQFLKSSLLGGAFTWTVPSFISQTMNSLYADTLGQLTQVRTGKDSPVLVVLQLAGGNDGLNTVVPYGNDFYYRARPSLGIKKKDVLRLDDGLGLHPALTELKGLYDDGLVGLVQGVGYPNPNRSHFRSMEIWQTASDADEFRGRGWIGRYFDNACEGCPSPAGIHLGTQDPQAFLAKTPKGISFKNADRLVFDDPTGELREDMFDESEGSGGSIDRLYGRRRMHGRADPLDFLERTAMDAEVSSATIRELSKTYRNKGDYPNTPLGRDLATVARLIGGGLGTRVYYVSLGGFDTHANQQGSHQNLMTVYAKAVGAFVKDLKAQGNLDRVTVLTFSEFGRRVAENGSGGTDHGTAAPVFLIGGGVRGGLYGKVPSLDPSTLDRGDLVHTVDFRSVYATILEKHLDVSSRKVLGRDFPLLKALA